jgi:hypothetical protein
VVEPIFDVDRTAALDRYGAALGQGLAASNLQSVLQAARDGRVDVLLVARGADVWGHIEDTPAELRIERTDSSADATDLSNYAVVRSLLAGATVYTIEPERMPSRAALASIFRYPA